MPPKRSSPLEVPPGARAAAVVETGRGVAPGEPSRPMGLRPLLGNQLERRNAILGYVVDHVPIFHRGRVSHDDVEPERGRAVRRICPRLKAREEVERELTTIPLGGDSESGSFQRALQVIREARATGLPVQINTTISKRNVEQVDAIAAFIANLNIILWSVFFLVPVGRGVDEERIEPEHYEAVFERLWHHAQRKPYSIKTTEAHHYRRFVLQQNGNPQRGAGEVDAQADPVQRAPLGVSDGKGCMFVSHIGQIFPSGFLPIEAGRFPSDSIVDVYQDAPIFRKLRDPDGFGGKCGRCEFRHICGGSRARAYAVTGDYMAAEPDCVYQPSEEQSR